MCGICGVAAVSGPLDPRFAIAIQPMTRALSHRGPDGEGYFHDEVCVLGQRRLAIIDRVGGTQPIENEDGTCWIAFNGEIYNHHDLRTALVARGHRFRTVSDTEAILHAYEEYGPACVDHLEGMFAFAIWDSVRRELFLARDRLGKKPLFYAALGGVLHFASEIKAFFASPLWDDDLDLEGLEAYLSLGYFVAPGTIYRHVRKLQPGHWLKLSRGQIETRQYWDVVEFDTDRRGEPKVLNDLEHLLRGATAERLESEVPLGAFLSGGIDSGLVVSFMAEALGEALVTTSVGFTDMAVNELDDAARTASHVHSRHYPQLVEPDVEEVFDRIVSGLDEPLADPSVIPTYYVSGIARQHVTVALSGDGGDESFTGYDFRYVPHAIEGRMRAATDNRLGRPLARGLARVWPRSPRLPRPLRLATVLTNLAGDAEAAYYNDLCFMKPLEARRLMGCGGAADPRDSPVYEAVAGAYRRCPSASPVQRAQYADLKIYLPNDVLVKVDRMSMMHSLEVRCPLLDRRVVEFAFRLPTATKMRGPWAKHLLRALAARRLPPGISRLPKRGFDAPVRAWITGPARAMFRDRLSPPTARAFSLVDHAQVQRALAELLAGARDHSYALWAVLVLETWLQRVGHAAPTRC